MTVEVVGGGPAGASACLSALREGVRVRVFEKSAFPRHKVCGEFVSPEVFPLFERLGVRNDFLALAPSRIRHTRLHFSTGSARIHTKRWTLAEPAYGVSRYALDAMLLRAAAQHGAEVVRETAPPFAGAARIVAYGRHSRATKGARLFGFKAHFSGTGDDAVDLMFFDGCYAGVSAVEGGAINVCGLAPERVLQRYGFHPDELLDASPLLRERVRGLKRTMEWLVTGPLVFRDAFGHSPGEYLAGDALGFVDPFTGSGLLAAVLTGLMAGTAAARAVPATTHLRACRRALWVQYRTAAMLRRVVENGWAAALAPLIPGKALFEFTRPRITF